MVANSTALFPDAMQTFDSSTMTSSYQALGDALAEPTRILKIINNSTKDITISWDGITDHDFVPIEGFSLYDVGTNRGNSAPELCIRKGTQIFVKGTAGTGSIYLVTFNAFTG